MHGHSFFLEHCPRYFTLLDVKIIVNCNIGLRGWKEIVEFSSGMQQSLKTQHQLSAEDKTFIFKEETWDYAEAEEWEFCLDFFTSD